MTHVLVDDLDTVNMGGTMKWSDEGTVTMDSHPCVLVNKKITDDGRQAWR